MGEIVDVVISGGLYRFIYRKKELLCIGINSGFRNIDYSNVVKILCIRIISGVFFYFIFLLNILNFLIKIYVLFFKIV